MISIVLAYGAAHAAVDAACAAVVASAAREHGLRQAAFFYSALAFGLQPLLGLAADRLRAWRPCVWLGCALTGAAGLAFPWFPAAGVAAIALGNAVFHVGAGSVCLDLAPGRAAASGYFVAPGAVGLFLGTAAGLRGAGLGWLHAGLLAAAALLHWLPAVPASGPRTARPEARTPAWELAVLLLLCCVASRSLTGFILDFPWKTGFAWAGAAAAAVALGKGAGGALADRFGWTRVACGGLLVSSVLLGLLSRSPLPALVGAAAFNLSMPVTLAALYDALPGWPGFSFGLACLALVAGAAPVFLGLGPALSGRWSVLVLGLFSAGALYCSLRMSRPCREGP